LDEPSTVLNLPEGPIIPQLVINEFVRTRAPRNAQQFLVPADYRAKQSQSRSRGRGQFIAKQVDDKDLLGSLRQRCHEEWGTEFPKPASVRCDRGEWRIKFFNHADDKKPSTFVKGPYRRLVPNGAHAFTQNFYLPDHMSTDELCEDLSDKLTARSDLDLRFRPKARLKRLIRQGKRGFVSSCLDVLESRFAQPVGDEAAKNIIFTLRQRLWPAINQARVFSADMLIRSPEGIGKTSTLFNEVASEIFDAALSNDRRFGCFAYRSNEQAEFKAQEYRASKDYRQAVVLVSFWEQYRRCCDQEGVNQIPKHEFPDHSLNGILRQI
jgi:hypothetical protein